MYFFKSRKKNKNVAKIVLNKIFFILKTIIYNSHSRLLTKFRYKIDIKFHSAHWDKVKINYMQIKRNMIYKLLDEKFIMKYFSVAAIAVFVTEKAMKETAGAIF